MRGFRWMVTGAALLATPALAQQSPQPPPRVERLPSQVQRLDPNTWLPELLLVNKWAVDASLIAQRQAATSQARKFAGQAVLFHQDLQRKLEQVAQQQGVDVAAAMDAPEPPEVEILRDALVTSLRGLPDLQGVSLDRAYLGAMVMAHDLAIAKVGWALDQLGATEQTRAGRDALVALERHRHDAWRLLGSAQIAPKVPVRAHARKVRPRH